MNAITLLQPQKIVFGTGCIQTLVDDYKKMGYQRLFVLTAPPILSLIEAPLAELKAAGVSIEVYKDIMAEPTVNDFKKILEVARQFKADSVVGIGGGSVLDVTKLVAAFLNSDQQVEDCFGTGFIKAKGLWFACLPTTAGTGSEVSPNAILLDERDHLKKGIVSPYLIAANLERAVKNGQDQEAREALAFGSLYGGLCLGPVNTAAVHALSYPLGGEFHIPHGLSNAILLPSVMKFNMPACPERYAEVAIACGITAGHTTEETAQRGVDFIYRLAAAVGIPDKLPALGIPQTAVDGMAKAAMQVQRLLKNNPREVTEQNARDIYNSLY